MKKYLGFAALFLAVTWKWWWEFLRSYVFEKLLGLALDQVSWDWVVEYGPVAAFAAFGLWLLRPALEERLFGFRLVTVEEAARIAYEAAERADALELVSMTGQSPDEKLQYFRYAFLLWPELTVYGVQPPSQAMRPIAREEYDRLHPLKGQPNTLAYGHEDRPRFVNVSVRRSDLRRGIKEHLPLIAQESARLRSRGAV